LEINDLGDWENAISMIEQHCSVKDAFAQGGITINSLLVMSMLGTLYRKRKRGWKTFLDNSAMHNPLDENIPENPFSKNDGEPVERVALEDETLSDIDVMRSDPIALMNDVSRVLANRFGFPMIDGQGNAPLMTRVLILCQDNLEFVEQMYDVWVERETRVPTCQALITLLAVYLSNYKMESHYYPRDGFVLKRARGIIEAMKRGGMYRETSVVQLIERSLKGDSWMLTGVRAKGVK
jgi:hypothetical protein